MNGIHPLACIGSPPEHRLYQEGEPMYYPDIAKSARISAFVTVDSGMGRPTRIGERCFLMAHTHIGHDCIIGDDCELAAGAVLAGFVELGKGVRVGVNATFRNRVTVGDGARIGAGAVVTKDVPAGETWVGCPARNIEERADHAWEELYGRR
jgi:acyl-[acyl carrier protein]--UDP-N-acetylglucosamine O-acyltransferase